MPIHNQQKIEDMLSDFISQIEKYITQQLLLILHHPKLQQLEAAWRGLMHLVQDLPQDAERFIKIKLCHLPWPILKRDLSQHDFHYQNSHIFNLIYQNEQGQLGGEPFSMIIGDYSWSQFSPFPEEDSSTLHALAEMASALFCPFLLGAMPIRIMQNLSIPYSLTFVTPRIIMRRLHDFEKRQRYKKSNYLWGNGAFMYAKTMAMRFYRQGWFISITDKISDTDLNNIRPDWPLQIKRHYKQILTEERVTQKSLSSFKKNGGILIVDEPFSENTYFKELTPLHSTAPSIPEQLCLAHIMQTLREILRLKMGKFNHPATLVQTLQNWLHRYTSEVAWDEQRGYPLHTANVSLEDATSNIPCFILLIQFHGSSQVHCIHLKLNTLARGKG